MKSEPQNRRISNIQPQKVGGCAVWVFSVLLVLVFGAIVWAECARSITNTTYQDSLAPIHTTTGNYYRGGIYTLDEAVGICTVTAYLCNDGNRTSSGYSLKLWSANADDNLTTLLSTSQDVYLGGNWTIQPDDNVTRCRKTFHFYEPVRVPAGRLAIAINDSDSTTHPLHFHSWVRGPAATGVEACAWTTTGGGNCTAEAAPMIEVAYVETPFLTATPYCHKWQVGAPPYTWVCPDYPSMGWLQIPEWAGYGMEWCQMTDNSTVACELPSAIEAHPGNYKLRGRFVPPDGNLTNASAWGHFRYKIVDSGGGETAVRNHTHGDHSATITGEYR